MAKVRINKLPQGFELVDGKVKKKALKRDGGMITGDQADYGLVTTPQEFYGQTNFNNDKDQSVRYSLSSVAREDANVEAEGGETVLTDLSGDGQFGLYGITGPRHSSGGVPMFLPEQSFIYSDTSSMKMDKSELAEFGIESRKKKTPAQVSRNYQLNPFYAEINSQYADDISTRSAELMLKKNMSNLSKLAFGQEIKKNFEDGVPLAAYPYLTEQGIDPIDFAATVEEQTRQQKELELIAQMPPQQQQQMLQMQAMMNSVDQPQQQQQGIGNPSAENAAMQDPSNLTPDQLAASDQQLMATLQRGGEKASDFYNKEGGRFTGPANAGGPAWPSAVEDPIYNADTKLWEFNGGGDSLSTDDLIALGMSYEQGIIPQDSPYMVSETATAVEAPNGEVDEVTATVAVSTDGVTLDSSTDPNPTLEMPAGFPTNHPDYAKFKAAVDSGNYTIISTRDEVNGGIKYEAVEIIKPNNFEDFVEEEVEQFKVYGSTDDMITVISPEDSKINEIYEGADANNVRIRKGIASGQKRPRVQGQVPEGISFGGDFSTPAAEEDFNIRYGDGIKERMPEFDYQMKSGVWNGNKPIDAQAKKYYNQWVKAQGLMQDIENENHAKAFGPNAKSKPRILFPCSNDRPGTCVDGKLGFDTFNKGRTYIKTQEQDRFEGFVEDPRKTPEPGPTPGDPVDQPDWWWQDLNNIATQNSLENPLFMPNVPKIPQERINYVLDDWTGKANMINANFNAYAKNLRAFGKGKVAGTSAYGKAAEQIGQAVGNTTQANIKTMNSVAIPQAQLNLRTGVANAKAFQDEYDGSIRALQRYVDFENWDKKETNKLYNQAITNRANTYNMNMLKDVMQTSPNLGGMQTKKWDKPLDQSKGKVDPSTARYDEMLEWEEKIKKQNPKMDAEERRKRLEYIMQGKLTSNNSRSNKNGYDDINNNDDPANDFDIPSVSVPNTQVSKKGGGMKRFAYPFYSGKMGI